MCPQSHEGLGSPKITTSPYPPNVASLLNCLTISYAKWDLHKRSTIRGDQNSKVKSLLANITDTADVQMFAIGRSQEGSELCQLFIAFSSGRNQVFDL